MSTYRQERPTTKINEAAYAEALWESVREAELEAKPEKITAKGRIEDLMRDGRWRTVNDISLALDILDATVRNAVSSLCREDILERNYCEGYIYRRAQEL